MTDMTAEIERLRTIVGSGRDPQGHAFATLAHALLRAGKPTEALEVVEAGRTTHNEFATGHVVAGLVHQALAAREPARAAFRRVLQLDPDNRVALRALAEIFESDGEPREALAYLVPLVEIEPDDIRLHERVARLQASVDAGAVSSEPPSHPVAPVPETAEAPIEASEISAPADAVTLSDDAMEWARERGREAVPEVSQGGVVTRTMGELLAGQGQYEEAIDVYEQLIERDPGDLSLQGRLEQLRARAAVPAATVDEVPPAEPARTVGDYFDELLEAHGDEPVLGPELLSVESPPAAAMAGVEPPAGHAPSPDVPPSGLDITLEPDQELATEGRAEGVGAPMESTVTRGETVPVAEVGPEAVPVSQLGPEATPVAELGPDAVPIAELGPDPIPVRQLAPDTGADGAKPELSDA